MEAKKKFFMDCHLAGRKYHDADEVWASRSASVTFPVPTTRRLPPSLRWGGLTLLSAASARSMRMLIQSIRFT